MKTICPKCNHSLTVMEVIQNRCSKCNSGERSLGRKNNGMEQISPSSSTIKKNFEALISEEMKKRMPPAA